LEAVESGVDLSKTAVLMTTAGGRNPDVLGSFVRLAHRDPKSYIVICLSPGSPLSALARRLPFVDFFDFAVPTGRDGFLATNSLLATAVILSRAYDDATSAAPAGPPTWGQVIEGIDASGEERRFDLLWKRRTLLVLYGPSNRSAAVDLESKFSEAALGNISIADYRNFAHGRHHWLAKRGDETAILALIDKNDRQLATRTLALLPRGIPIVRETITLGGIYGRVSALVRALFVVGTAGRARGIDPGRPGVPSFGRRIYHISAFGRAKDHDIRGLAIQRKAKATLKELDARGLLSFWSAAYERFVSGLVKARFKGVVFDYDGTLCGEFSRFGPLSAEVAASLKALVTSGITVGIATGRGKSVRVALRQAIPKRFWDRVLVGYYNGGDIAALADDSRPLTEPTETGVLSEVESTILGHGLGRIAEVERRPPQITIRAHDAAQSDWLFGTVQHLVLVGRWPQVLVLRSTHSIDVLCPGVDKRNVVWHVAERGGMPTSAVLPVGDQGAYPGNDFQLLSLPNSLSVDEVSPEPSTCWNLSSPGLRSTHALLHYLGLTKLEAGQIRFVLQSQGERV
jgi:hypothetical protein